MIKVCFIFENAYTYNPESLIEDLRVWLPVVPRKGETVDFCDFIFTTKGKKRGDGTFIVDDVIFDMAQEDGSFAEIVVSLIPTWVKNEGLAFSTGSCVS